MGGNQTHRNKIVPVGLDSNYHTEPINEQQNAEGEVVLGNNIIQDGADINNGIIRDSQVNESVEMGQDIRILHNNYETQLRQLKSSAESRHHFTDSK